MRVISPLLNLSCLVAFGAAHAATPEAAAARLETFLRAIPTAGPALAVQIVSRDKVLLEFARGTRRASTPAAKAPVTADTPFYIASQTKAFMGLLAAKLDAKGILKLDSTLEVHWPGIAWPEGFDAKAWTLGDLLSHQVPLTADALVFLEAYVRRLSPEEHTLLLERHARLRDPGFQYSNLGYSLYGAALQKATGRTWQQWLAQEVLLPAGLTRTASRARTFRPGEVAWGHQWLGAEKGWRGVPPKPDGLMHAAGGLMASPADLGRWLQMHLRQQGPGLETAVFQAAQRARAKVDPKAKNAYELPCHGHALGWNLCDFEGHTLYIHGGSYTGTRTMMAFSPDLNVGIAVCSNSDNMTGWLVSRTIVQFLQYLVDHPDAEKMAALRIQQYPIRTQKWLEHLAQQQQKVRSEPQWAGWSWKPTGTELGFYEGQYQTSDGLQTLKVFRSRGTLAVSHHAFQAPMEPAAEDLFGVQASPLDAPEPLTFQRDAGARIVSANWQGEVFLRLPSPSSRHAQQKGRKRDSKPVDQP